MAGALGDAARAADAVTVKELQDELKALEMRLTIKMGGVALAAVALLTTLLMLIH